MTTRSEQLLETLLDLERSRQRERELRIESEALLERLHQLNQAKDNNVLFFALIDMLRVVIDFQEAFILQKQEDQIFRTIASSSPIFHETIWHNHSLFQRVLKGRPAASFDVALIPEWQEQSPLVHRCVKSALHIPLETGFYDTILVITHSQPRHFSAGHVQQARRFSPLASQALQTLNLQRSLTQRDRFFQLSFDLMGIINFFGSFRQFNAAWSRVLGYTDEELKNKRLLDLAHPLDSPQLNRSFAQLSQNRDAQIECRFVCKDGSYRWLSCSLAPYIDEGLCYIVARDVTDRVQAEQQLLLHARRETDSAFSFLDAVLDNLADGLLVTDAQGTVLRANPTFFNMLDLNAQDANLGPTLEGPLRELIRKCQNNPHEIFETELELPRRRIGQATGTGILHRREANFARENGLHPKSTPSQEELDAFPSSFQYSKHIETSEHNIFQTDDFLGVTVLLRDITTEKEVDKMKTEFISTVSHELRTPLTSILGFAKLIHKRLNETIFPNVQAQAQDRKLLRAVEQVRSNMEIIVSEGERLTSLINDVLDIAKMESGKLEWHMRPIDLQEAIQRAIAATQSLLEESGLTLEIDIENDLPPVAGDLDRLLQVLINLISNAIKFTERGSIICRVRKVAREIVVSITDTGIGIPKEDLHKVFEKFRQVGDTLTDKPKGTGLGLPICKEIIEHHDGRIGVESELGKGSTFFFALPINLQQSLETPIIGLDELLQQIDTYRDIRLEQSQRDHKRILLVDDETTIRQLLAQELQVEDAQIIEASDGPTALMHAEQAKPDLILLDVLMPKMSGLEVASQLKQRGPFFHTPLLVLSIMETREDAFGLGVANYFTKPLGNQLLQEAITESLQHALAPLSILLYDEAPDAAQSIMQHFQKAGDHVVWCSTFQDCLQHIQQHKIDILLLHEQSAKKSGFLRQLRALSLPPSVLLKVYQTPLDPNPQD
ncbi:MAG: response regulator [Myxococcales bacterium]|nr:response regulator [Myxococcales bacterium]